MPIIKTVVNALNLKLILQLSNSLAVMASDVMLKNSIFRVQYVYLISVIRNFFREGQIAQQVEVQ